MGFFLWWLLLFQNMGSRHMGSVVVAHRLRCSEVCGIFSDQGLNLCLLYFLAYSSPLSHQGSLEVKQFDLDYLLPKGLPWWLNGRESACNAGVTGDASSIPESGRSPGGGRGNPLQYSCLEDPMDRGAWQATVHSTGKSRTWLQRLNARAHTHTHTPCTCYLEVELGLIPYVLVFRV